MRPAGGEGTVAHERETRRDPQAERLPTARFP